MQTFTYDRRLLEEPAERLLGRIEHAAHLVVCFDGDGVLRGQEWLRINGTWHHVAESSAGYYIDAVRQTI